MIVLVIGALVAFGLFLLYKARLDAQRRDGFIEFMTLAAAASQTKVRQPDMTFAASSYARIAVMRLSDPNANFHATEQTYAETLRSNGATDLEVMSAIWGGVYGNDADLQDFKNDVADFELSFAETVRATGRTELALTNPTTKFHMAATKHLALVMADAPDEFERFLAFMKK